MRQFTVKYDMLLLKPSEVVMMCGSVGRTPRTQLINEARMRSIHFHSRDSPMLQRHFIDSPKAPLMFRG